MTENQAEVVELNMKSYKVCFIGHRKVEEREKVFERVKEVVKRLIEDAGVREFLFGSRSEFDVICHSVVTGFIEKVSGIKRINYTCKSEWFIHESEREKIEKVYSSSLHKEVHLCGYEEEVHHKTKYVAGIASYVERNRAMIDDSDICVFYYNESYTPSPRRHSKKELFPYLPKSGTRLAYDYAKRKQKKIINVFNDNCNININM